MCSFYFHDYETILITFSDIKVSLHVQTQLQNVIKIPANISINFLKFRSEFELH